MAATTNARSGCVRKITLFITNNKPKHTRQPAGLMTTTDVNTTQGVASRSISSPSRSTIGLQILTRALMNQLPTCARVIPLRSASTNLSASSGYGLSKCLRSQSRRGCVLTLCALNLNRKKTRRQSNCLYEC